MTYKTPTELTTEIERCKQELAKLEKQLETVKAEPYDVQVARELHGTLCAWNHTDGCSWFYEFDYVNKKEDWKGSAHSRYLAQARKLIHVCEEKSITPEFALELAKMLTR